MMDVRNMEFIPDQCFDLIIDKGIQNTLSSYALSALFAPLSITICKLYLLTLLVFGQALFDAVLCSENNLSDVSKLMREVYRVLKTGAARKVMVSLALLLLIVLPFSLGGRYIMVSHGGPDSRIPLINKALTSSQASAQGIELQIDVQALRK